MRRCDKAGDHQLTCDHKRTRTCSPSVIDESRHPRWQNFDASTKISSTERVGIHLDEKLIARYTQSSWCTNINIVLCILSSTVTLPAPLSPPAWTCPPNEALCYSQNASPIVNLILSRISSSLYFYFPFSLSLPFLPND